MNQTIGYRLEQYTIKRPDEVLLVDIELAGEKDCIMIYKGFSSSLVNPTASDPDIPVLPATAKIIAIARLASPYNPQQPQYIEEGITEESMLQLLESLHI